MREFGSELVEVYWCRRRGLLCAASVFTKNKQQSAWRSARAYTKQSALCESVCVSKFGEHVVFASCVMNCMTVWLVREGKYITRFALSRARRSLVDGVWPRDSIQRRQQSVSGAVRVCQCGPACVSRGLLC